MPFSLGAKSLAELGGVHPNLVKVVKRAIEITSQDFSVHDGPRTIAEQREYVRRGVSKTMKSRHLVQPDGLGHAVDLVPWVNGKLRFEWEPIFHIAPAMAKAAKELGVRIVWGGAWDKRMDEYPCANAAEAKAAVEAYKARHAGSDFIDGPHFQLSD